MKDMAFREQKQHGSLDFPVGYYCVDPQYYQYVMPLHWHREPELVQVRRGTLRIYLNSVLYTLRQGDVLYISGGVLHRGEPEDCVYDCVVFDPNLLGSRMREYTLPLLSGECAVQPFYPGEESWLSRSMHTLCTLLRTQPPHYRLGVHGCLANILYGLYDGGHISSREHTGRTGHQSSIVARAVAYIDENYRDHITLAQLAQVAAVHEKYLCRIFREYTGMSPMAYVNSLRIDRACIDMTLHHKNVTEAAMDAGFADLSYFTKLFKRTKGITPREYMKKPKHRGTQL